MDQFKRCVSTFWGTEMGILNNNRGRMKSPWLCKACRNCPDFMAGELSLNPPGFHHENAEFQSQMRHRPQLTEEVGEKMFFFGGKSVFH